MTIYAHIHFVTGSWYFPSFVFAGVPGLALTQADGVALREEMNYPPRRAKKTPKKYVTFPPLSALSY